MTTVGFAPAWATSPLRRSQSEPDPPRRGPPNLRRAYRAIHGEVRNYRDVITAASMARSKTTPRGAGNAIGGSNPEIANTIGGLPMSVARPAHASIARAPFNCDPWTGRPSEYQMEARAVLQERFHDPLPWIYAVTSCETKHCLTTLHLNYHRARKINYPAGVCTYCGLPGFTKDHLLPVTSTGLAVRRYVAVVPACGECNSGIGDRVGHRVGERRDQAHEYIRIKHRRTLNAPKWTPQLLAELGPNLRAFMQHSEDLREVVNTRLAWPLDPDYDLRAFQKSGIDDPYGLDLI